MFVIIVIVTIPIALVIFLLCPGTVMPPILPGSVESDLPCFLNSMGASTTTTVGEKEIEMGR